VVEFFETEQAVKRCGLLQLAANHACIAGLYLWFDTKWNQQAADIACLFHRPEIINTGSTIGWDADLNGFRLANFNILSGGRITQDCTPPAINNQLPTQRILPPVTVPHSTIRQLTEYRGGMAVAAELFWLTITLTVAGIFARRNKQTMPPSVVLGTAAQTHTQFFTDNLGCLRLSTAQRPLVSQAICHNWPTYLQAHDKWIVPTKWAQLNNCFIELPSSMEFYGELAGWSQITVPEDTLPLTLSGNALQPLLPLYLQHLCLRQLALPDYELPTLLNDIAGWVQATWKCNLNPEHIIAHYQPSTSVRQATALRKLLQTVRNISQIAGDFVRIDQKLAAAATYPAGYTLDVYTATCLLHKVGVLEHTNTAAGQWTVPLNWWQS
jgi:hypothetical protein